MRLQLTVIVAVALGATAFPRAVALGDPPRVESVSRVGLYHDSDRTTIWTATSGVTGNINDRLQVGARYLVDAVSSASVDVVSQATGRFHDLRQDISGNAGYKDENRSLLANYSYSVENDWRSHNVGVSGSQDLMHHSLTLGGSLGAQDNAITRSHSIGFARQLRAYFVNLSISYAATSRDLVQASLAVSYYDGFQSSPYRYLIVGGQAILESYPDQRWREALVLRHHHYFSRGWALRSHGRAYADTYGVHAITVGTEGILERLPFDVGLALRGYGQTCASFYREEYASVERYMARDKELSTFVNLFVGPTLGFTREKVGPFDSLRVDARASGFYFHYFDFARLRERYGLVTDVGLSALF